LPHAIPKVYCSSPHLPHLISHTFISLPSFHSTLHPSNSSNNPTPATTPTHSTTPTHPTSPPHPTTPPTLKNKGMDDEIDPAQSSLLTSMVVQLASSLKSGMDLSAVTLPAFVLEARSMLEKVTDFMAHPEILIWYVYILVF